MGPGHDEGIGLTDNSIIYVRGADLSPALVLHELGHHRLWVQFAGAREATQGDKDRLVRIRKRRIGPLLKLSEGELAALGLTKLSLANVFELGADAYLAAMHAAPEQVQRLSQALFGVDLTREQLIDYLDERLLKDDAAAAAVMADTLEAAAGVRRGSALTP